MSRIFVALATLILFPSVVFSQKYMDRGYRTIQSADARLFVGVLASDSLQGREAGEAGGRMAATYIVSLLDEWGIEPLSDDGYLQPFAVDGCDMNNILAVIPGKRNEYVIVGAHYDHLGIGVAVDGDSCYNGADDNASGVSAVLQIARAVKKTRRTPQRGIIFAFWDGEEKGLLGSRHFVENCSFLSDVSAYMNFDMAGRGPVDNPKHLTYFYTASHPLFGDWLKEDMEARLFSFIPDYRAWDKPTGGSDNAWFAKNGIPIVWYHTEGHPDYHRPSDTADKIDYEKLIDITRAAFLCVWRLANEVY
ncbi:MAG: M20/M25/M40 family metallo-hydrolase [Bacteroidaceae bacterium]|nr:M20/M25/M40 family metallo-hydrolase [Bacteroidaceae bacterium]